ncbi:MAG: hypothetical protein F8N15_09705 [Methanobacterium sp.]|nr:hypothetical protein [Methanobacterium sp.]
MDTDTQALSDLIIDRFSIETIEDVIKVLPRSMCHVIQEPRVFDTYQPQMVRLVFPPGEWDAKDARYREVRDEIIPRYSTMDYLSNLLLALPDRLPCFCSQMAEVTATLVSKLLKRNVYILRNIYVNYLYLPKRWHCINAISWEGRIRYFDSSAYAQVFDKITKRVLRPNRLAGFNASDIDIRFIVAEDWLQDEPFPRRIMECDGHLSDSFYPSPIPSLPPDEFFRVVGPDGGLRTNAS